MDAPLILDRFRNITLFFLILKGNEDKRLILSNPWLDRITSITYADSEAPLSKTMSSQFSL